MTKNKILKKFIHSLLMTFVLFFFIGEKQVAYADGNTGNYLAIAPDFDFFSYATSVSTDSHSFVQSNFKEFKYLNAPKGFNTPMPLSPTQEWKADQGGDNLCMFTFPACGSEASKTGPDSKDNEAITRVTTQVINQFNQAIGFIMTNATDNGINLTLKDYTDEQKRELFFEITGKLGNATIKMKDKGNYATDITIKDTTFNVKKKSAKSSYLILTEKKSGKSIELRYRIQKYSEGKVDGTTDKDRSGSFPTIYWFHVAWIGNSAYVNGGYQAVNVDAMGDVGFVEKVIVEMLNHAITELRTMLGTNPIEDIMFNQGNFASSFWNGIAPESWFGGGTILSAITIVIAIILLMLALVWRYGMLMWGTLTPFRRASIIEGIKDIFVSAITLSLIYPIFTTIIKFNTLFVDIMANLTPYNDRISVASVSSGTLPGMIISIVFFVIELYFNFIYIIRGVTIVLLYGMAPLFCVMYAFGGKAKEATFRYLKELVGNIFIHSFHAMFLAFFAIFINTGSFGLLTKIAIFVAFIPMTKLFKQLFGIGGSDFIHDTAKGMSEQTMATLKEVGSGFKNGAGKVISKEVEKIKNPNGNDKNNDGDNYNSLTTTGSLGDSFSGKDVSRKQKVLNAAKYVGKEGYNLTKGLPKSMGSAGLGFAGVALGSSKISSLGSNDSIKDLTSNGVNQLGGYVMNSYELSDESYQKEEELRQKEEEHRKSFTVGSKR